MRLFHAVIWTDHQSAQILRFDAEQVLAQKSGRTPTTPPSMAAPCGPSTSSSARYAMRSTESPRSS